MCPLGEPEKELSTLVWVPCYPVVYTDSSVVLAYDAHRLVDSDTSKAFLRVKEKLLLGFNQIFAKEQLAGMGGEGVAGLLGIL